MQITFEELIALAEDGNVDAMVDATRAMVWGGDASGWSDQIKKDRIVQYLHVAVNTGNVKAMNLLGAMYAEGKVVDPDPEQSFMWYKMAADYGNPDAISNTGFCYFYGKGTEIDYAKAYEYLSKAGQLDIGDAIVRLGDMYLMGYHVKQDVKMALTLYYKAYGMSRSHDLSGEVDDCYVYSDVCRRLGDCHYIGAGLEKNLIEAFHYYSEAYYYYLLRDRNGDFYSSEGLEKTKNRLMRVLSEIKGTEETKGEKIDES